MISQDLRQIQRSGGRIDIRHFDLLFLEPVFFAGFATRCFGPLFAAAVTARLNRSQPSGRSSISFFGSDFAMAKPPGLMESPKRRLGSAKRKIRRLEKRIATFFKNKPGGAVTETDAQGV